MYSQVGSIRATWPWAGPLPAAFENSPGKGCGKFQTLQPLAPCFPRIPAILLHGLKELSRKKLLNAQVKSNFRCKSVENRTNKLLTSAICGSMVVDRFRRWPPGRRLRLNHLLKRSTATPFQGNGAGISWSLPPYLPRRLRWTPSFADRTA